MGQVRQASPQRVKGVAVRAPADSKQPCSFMVWDVVGDLLQHPDRCRAAVQVRYDLAPPTGRGEYPCQRLVAGLHLFVFVAPREPFLQLVLLTPIKVGRV